MADSVPAGVPPDAAELAQSTLGGALAAAEPLPDPLGAALLATAREAFGQSLDLVALTSVMILIVTAIVAVTRLRSAKPVNPVKEKS
jgi:DHA2 family multidrug resistance protein-like MFS transporter